tara:strand:+ start:3565 stop:3885 length:321 start_codon:yes stop_codon:yes gene_type:complete
MNFPIVEIIGGLLAAIAAYYSIRAKIEAGQANDAVNHADEGKPRLYDIALSNYEGLARIKERQKSIERTIDKLEENQTVTLYKVKEHDKILKQHSKVLSKLTKKEE